MAQLRFSVFRVWEVLFLGHGVEVPYLAKLYVVFCGVPSLRTVARVIVVCRAYCRSRVRAGVCFRAQVGNVPTILNATCRRVRPRVTFMAPFCGFHRLCLWRPPGLVWSFHEGVYKCPHFGGPVHDRRIFFVGASLIYFRWEVPCGVCLFPLIYGGLRNGVRGLVVGELSCRLVLDNGCISGPPFRESNGAA